MSFEKQNPLTLSDSELLSLHRRGLIPGPNEVEALFLERIDSIEAFSAAPPIDEKQALPMQDWKEANQLTDQLFDFKPDWMVAFYSDRHLPFWQGAATWIYETPVRVPLLQLRKKFCKGSYLKMYTRSEVLAHEAAHAARMGFDEKKFEEILAYSTSKRSWRKWLGPLFRSSWESYVFVVLLAVPLLAKQLDFFGRKMCCLSGYFFCRGSLFSLRFCAF